MLEWLTRELWTVPTQYTSTERQFRCAQVELSKTEHTQRVFLVFDFHRIIRRCRRCSNHIQFDFVPKTTTTTMSTIIKVFQFMIATSYFVTTCNHRAEGPNEWSECARDPTEKREEKHNMAISMESCLLRFHVTRWKSTHSALVRFSLFSFGSLSEWCGSVRWAVMVFLHIYSWFFFSSIIMRHSMHWHGMADWLQQIYNWNFSYISRGSHNFVFFHFCWQLERRQYCCVYHIVGSPRSAQSANM